MTGRVIFLKSYRNSEQRAAPQLPKSHLACAGRSQGRTHPAKKSRILKLQVARIQQLVDEVEDLARASGKPTLAALGRVRSILELRSQFQPNDALVEDIESDPQPVVDAELLERMYRNLNPHA